MENGTSPVLKKRVLPECLWGFSLATNHLSGTPCDFIGLNQPLALESDLERARARAVSPSSRALAVENPWSTSNSIASLRIDLRSNQ
jgi:hypothetical protein